MWPLLVICVMWAIVAGFFIWILETYWNEKEFPRPFLSGLFEGFWWSFVSMTTVGYGDKGLYLSLELLTKFWKTSLKVA